MSKCNKCGKSGANKCHDRDDNDIVKFLCDDCQGMPEYRTRCPHCAAEILVN